MDKITSTTVTIYSSKNKAICYNNKPVSINTTKHTYNKNTENLKIIQTKQFLFVNTNFHFLSEADAP